MSLIDAYMVPCVMLSKMSEPDGEGGERVSWVERGKFTAAIKLDAPSAIILADKPAPSRSCTVTTFLPKYLHFGDVFRRQSDGAVFRATSNSEEQKTPAQASFQIAQCKAERWELP